MAAEYKAQLLAVETKLSKDPDNEELLSLKADLIELIELSCSLETDEDDEPEKDNSNSRNDKNSTVKSCDRNSQSSGSKGATNSSDSNIVNPNFNSNIKDKNGKRPLTEAELLAKKKEKNRRKKAKLREKIKEQLDIAESEKQTWQSFANKKGLKGVTKKSIFASPCSLTGKVGVGTNGIADAPSVSEAAAASATIASTGTTKRKYQH